MLGEANDVQDPSELDLGFWLQPHCLADCCWCASARLWTPAVPALGSVAHGVQLGVSCAECPQPAASLTMARSKGRLLVLEGIDGCGKTTQLQQLSSWLPTSGLMPAGSQLIVTREPGGTALGTSLRELLLHPPQDADPGPTAELLMYAADRAQHVDRVIQPALERGDWVLSDRFTGSTMAYQGYGRSLDRVLITELERIATRGLSPDMTIWLDLPLELSVQRRGSREEDRMEAEGFAFLERVAKGFSDLAKTRGWVSVVADRPLLEVAESIQTALLTRAAAWQS